MGLAGPSGTCHLNPIPALLSCVDEHSRLLWDPVTALQQRWAELMSSAEQQGQAGGKRGATSGGNDSARERGVGEDIT